MGLCEMDFLDVKRVINFVINTVFSSVPHLAYTTQKDKPMGRR